MGLITWFNRRIENNAPALAGALAYGGAYVNPFLSEKDAQMASVGARRLTDKALQSTAPLREMVAGSSDAAAAGGGRLLVNVADVASGGLVAPPARRAYADASALYDKASTLAPILTLDNQPRSYKAELFGESHFSRQTLASQPIEAQAFKEGITALGVDPHAGKTAKLLESLQSHGDFLKTEGYASLLQLARDKGPKGVEEICGKLTDYLEKGQKNLDFRREVAANGLRDVAFPTTIEQGPKGNCGAIAVQQMWARQLPAQYLDALTNLAEDRGHRFSNGQVLSPLNDSLNNPDDSRNPSVKIMGDAIARHAHERSLTRQGGLEIGRDASQRLLGRELGPTPLDNYHPDKQPLGIHAPFELATVLGDITGHTYSWKVNDALSSGLKQVSAGQPVACLISGAANSEWHWVQMTGRAGPDVKMSTWGDEYRVPPDKLAPFLRAVLIDEGPSR